MIFGNANYSQCLNRLENGCKRIIKLYCGGDSVHVFFLRPPGIPVEAVRGSAALRAFPSWVCWLPMHPTHGLPCPESLS